MTPTNQNGPTADNSQPVNTPSHHATNFSGPGRDAPLDEILAYLAPPFKVEVFDVILANMPLGHSRHDRREFNLLMCSMLAKALGLPSDHDYHEQPYDLLRMWGLPFSLDAINYQYARDVDIQVFEALFCFWIFWSIETANRGKAIGLGVDDVIYDIHYKSLQIMYFFMFPDKWFKYKIKTMEKKRSWFIFTAGCFDLESGALVNPERATDRDFEFQGADL